MGMEPGSWALIASVAMQVAQQVSQSQQEASQDQADEETLNRNVGIVSTQTDQEIQGIRNQSERDKEEARRQYKRNQSGARVALATGGVSDSTGSALELLSSNAASHVRDLAQLDYNAALREQQARYGGQRTIYGLRRAGQKTSAGNSSDWLGMGQSLLSLGSSAFGGTGSAGGSLGGLS